MEISENVPLSSYSTMGIGGLALYLTKVATAAAMKEAVLFAKSKNIPFLVIGKGSNSLFDDKGFPGLAIVNKIDFCHEEEGGVFHVGSGYSFSLLGAQTAKKCFSGLEFASGIPATVGGAIYMNAGASGSETQETLISVDYMDADGFVRTYEKNEMAFSYRKSSFQSMQGAILSAKFQLKECPKAREKQIAIIKYRTKTQPYGDKSCGCAFQNPPGEFAGKLIEKCGLKGLQLGGAEVSMLHANFIINKGGATQEDVRALIALIKERVKEKEGIELHEEICFIPGRINDV